MIIDRLIGVVAPHQCIKCQAEGSLVCAWCRPDIWQPLPSRCYRCRALTENSAVCTKCRRSSPLKHVWVCTDYSDYAERLIRLFKFERAKAAAEVIGESLEDLIPYFASISVVPVPTASSRTRSRGYDQAELIAKSLAKLTGYAYEPILGRTGQTRQVGASRKARLEQLLSSFYVKRTGWVEVSNVLLVDDVVTTGATLEAAARSLKNSGAKQVNAVVFAQKL